MTAFPGSLAWVRVWFQGRRANVSLGPARSQDQFDEDAN